MSSQTLVNCYRTKGEEVIGRLGRHSQAQSGHIWTHIWLVDIYTSGPSRSICVRQLPGFIHLISPTPALCFSAVSKEPWRMTENPITSVFTAKSEQSTCGGLSEVKWWFEMSVGPVLCMGGSGRAHTKLLREGSILKGSVRWPARLVKGWESIWLSSPHRWGLQVWRGVYWANLNNRAKGRSQITAAELRFRQLTWNWLLSFLAPSVWPPTNKHPSQKPLLLPGAPLQSAATICYHAGLSECLYDCYLPFSPNWGRLVSAMSQE